MTIGIVGLGLIGGSLAKAVKSRTGHRVLGLDGQNEVVRKALWQAAIDRELKSGDLSSCDIVIIALYPKDAVDFIRDNAARFRKGGIVLDCCGVKGAVCAPARGIAEEFGFTFVGGHPMAGLAHSGFDYAKASLFDNAPMILTPDEGTPEEALGAIKNLCAQIGFGRTIITTPEHHDRMIAYTSQLAHIVSNAYIKTPLALKHDGYSAGSFRDMTRVSRLKADMWTELFIDNGRCLLEALDGLIGRLSEYKSALERADADGMAALLEEGNAYKDQMEQGVGR